MDLSRELAVVRKHGSVPKRKYPPEWLDAAIDMKETGMPARLIAKKLKVTPSAITLAIRSFA